VSDQFQRNCLPVRALKDRVICLRYFTGSSQFFRTPAESNFCLSEHFKVMLSFCLRKLSIRKLVLSVRTLLKRAVCLSEHYERELYICVSEQNQRSSLPVRTNCLYFWAISVEAVCENTVKGSSCLSVRTIIKELSVYYSNFCICL
jgi:hypothetical protein